MPYFGKLPESGDLREGESQVTTGEDSTDKSSESSEAIKLIESVTFFGDSAIPEGDSVYQDAYNCAKKLAEEGYSIVNGGGPGIMKAATDGVEEVGGKTVAVYWEPKLATYFEGKNLANITTESEGFSNYMMRTLGLIEKGDAFVVCKGGTGTISELGMVWCLAKLYYGCHKPVILYGDFWDDMVLAMQKAMILDEVELGVLLRATSPDQVIRLLKEHELKVAQCAVTVNGDDDEAAFVISPKTKVTNKSYNRHASNYHAEHAGKLEAQDLLDEFIELVRPPARVLDVGTGSGYDSGYLAQRYSVMGIEPSHKFAELAKFENPGLNIQKARIEDYELEDDVYKGIWARDSLHHVAGEDLDQVFQKLANALVPGGVLYIVVREGEGEFTEKTTKSYGELERFYHLFSSEELMERAKRVGLDLHSIRNTKRSHKWLVGVFNKPEN